MRLSEEITKMNGTKVNYKTLAVDLLPSGENDHKIKSLCINCQTAYKERPLICRCSSNVFLKDVENGKLI